MWSYVFILFNQPLDLIQLQGYFYLMEKYKSKAVYLSKYHPKNVGNTHRTYLPMRIISED